MSVATPKWQANPLPAVQHYVNSVAISADGGRVVAGTYYFDYSKGGHRPPTTLMDVGTFAYDAAGNLLWSHQFPATVGVYWVALSRDAKWAAAGGLESSKKGFVYAYNAATGAKKLLGNPVSRVNMVALNNNGSVLVAACETLNVYTRKNSTWTALPPVTLPPHDEVVYIGVSGDGKWIAAGTFRGAVYLMSLKNGVLSSPTIWQSPSVGTKPASVYWVAMATNGSGFVAGTRDTSVSYFDTATFATTKKPQWTETLIDCRGACRAVAISDDGQFVSAAAANKTGAGGHLHLFANTNGAAHHQWSRKLLHSPNSTSLDATGKYVTAADGWPNGTKGRFYLYDTKGHSLWHYTTADMSWPMQVNAQGTAAAAGSDDANVYYFRVP